MRLILLAIALGSAAWSQTITEFGAAAAGGAIGGAGGKKVSDGLTNILDKIDQQTTASAASPAPKPAPTTAPAAPLISVGPGMPGTSGPSSAPSIDGSRPRVARAAVVVDSVPPPPPLPQAAVRPVQPIMAPQPVVMMAAAPPPPPVTMEDLSTLSQGQSREEVLKLGQPAARITMDDDGHLLEIYRYMSNDTTFGVVRLVDGAVSSIDLRR